MARRVKLLGWVAVVLAAAGARAESPGAVEARLRKDVTFLASPACEGRGPTTKGIDRAADYLAAEFKRIGLRPAGEGGYFQPFAIRCAEMTLAVEGPGGRTVWLEQGRDFSPLGLDQQGRAVGGLVFAGYGVTCKDPAYDDYKDLDVRGKVVVALRDTPRADRKRTAEMRRAGSLAAKMALARKRGAVGLLVVNDREAASAGDEPINFSYSNLARGGDHLPAAIVRRGVIDNLLPAGKSLDALQKRIDDTLEPVGFAVPGRVVHLHASVNKAGLPLKNVVGYLEGAGPLAAETVVVGAHYDHLGYGGTSSLAATKKRLIHPGADDNASGTAAMLEIARHFAALPNRQGRRLVFAAFSGEEIGLFGSKYYCEHPAFPLDRTAAMFNLDMVGRLHTDPKTKKDRLLSEGHGTAKAFKPLLDRLTKEHGFALTAKASGFGPSDHASFCEKKVPVLFLWTGDHDDYHRPGDTADKVNYAGAARVVAMSEEVVAALATMPRPAFVEVKGGSGVRMTGGPRLGVRPDYEWEGPGMKVKGVGPDSPAERGGLRGGDVIVSIGGKPVKEIKTYMQAMATQKPGTTTEVTVERGGKRVTLKVKLD